ncbi:hypothetical protein DFH09DRAFT_1078647 [Mycena vulgaris]|nr:hypothetical protein DFH09DRAFT_1078647 [Mycena vulgaris]
MFILLHAAVAARRRLALPLSAKPISVQVQEKSALKTSPKPASSWPPLSLSWETLPLPPASSASASPLLRGGPVRRPEPALASRPRVEAPHARVNGEDDHEPPYLPPSLPLSISRLGLSLTAARAHAGCEREHLRTAAAIVSGSARERMRGAKRWGGASTPPLPTSSQRPSSPGAACMPCALHTPALVPLPLPESSFKLISSASSVRRRPGTSATLRRTSRLSVSQHLRTPASRLCRVLALARIGVGVGVGTAALRLSSSTLNERRYGWMKEHRALPMGWFEPRWFKPQPSLETMWFKPKPSYSIDSIQALFETAGN